MTYGTWDTMRQVWTLTREQLEAHIAREREACAKLAEQTICDTHIPTGLRIYGTRVADAIRARGEK